VVEVSGGYDVMDRADKFGNNDVFKGKVMDDYTRAVNKVNNGIDGLYPIVGLVNASGPYEWWDTAAIKMLPKQFYPVDAILAGGKITLCTQCAVRRGINEGDQIPGIVIAGAASFVEEILQPNVQALVY
jgi:hypothetical protein